MRQRTVAKKKTKAHRPGSSWQVPISPRALLQRVNRRQKLKVFRLRGQNREVFGEYVIHIRPGLVQSIENFEEYARKLGALHPWETVEKERDKS